MAGDGIRSDRRAFLRATLGATGAVALGGVAAACRKPPQGPNGGPGTTLLPASAATNVLVIMCDDMRADELSFMPRLSSMAARHGTTFTQARQSTSMCSPARATFLRGQVATGPQGHGVVLQSSNYQALEPETVAVWSRSAGLRTGIVGKYFVGLTVSVRPGWDRMVTSNGPNHAAAYGYSILDTDQLGLQRPEQRQSIYLRDAVTPMATAEGPWFVWYCPHEPHTPLEWTTEDIEAVLDVEWPYSTAGLASKPPWIQALPEPDETALESRRWIQRQRLAELRELDACIDHLLTAMLGAGRLQDTVVLFTSDNGDALYDYGRLPVLEKNFPYDVSCKVPLIAFGPGFVPGATVDAPVAVGVDMAATVLEVARATATMPQHGRSLFATVADPAGHAERAMLGGNRPLPHQVAQGMPPSDWVVAGRRKLIRYQGVDPSVAYEAFDLDIDPGELVSWAYDPVRLAERDALEALLDQLYLDPASG